MNQFGHNVRKDLAELRDVAAQRITARVGCAHLSQ